MSEVTSRTDQQPMTSKLLRGAIWIAIGALIAAALVCVVWVLIGDQDGIIGRAFLTILLLALFAGVAIAEAHLAAQRPDWLALASMVSWIVVLLVGAVKIWLPRDDMSLYSSGWVAERFFQFLLVIGILQLALLHVRLFTKASQRYVTVFTRVIVITTFVMLAAVVAMLVFYLTFPHLFRYNELYWRIVIALTILAAVGTTLIPLLNALFAPRAKQPAPAVAQAVPGYAPQAPVASAWPTYADGRTPLPVMPDGSPDWNAYYTGRPTYDPYAQRADFPVPEQPAPTPDAAASAFPAPDVPAPQAPASDAPASPAPPSNPAPPSSPAQPPAAPPPAPPHGNPPPPVPDSFSPPPAPPGFPQ